MLSDHLKKTHRPNFSVKIYKAITSSHDFGDLHLVANLMHEEMLKESDGSITSLKDRKHDVSSFLSKGSSEIPIFSGMTTRIEMQYYWNGLIEKIESFPICL